MLVQDKAGEAANFLSATHSRACKEGGSDMDRQSATVRMALVWGALLLLAACSSKYVVESDLHFKGAPDWGIEGTQILKTGDGRLFHGIGSAPPLGDMSLQTSTADARARAVLVRVLSSYMNVVSNDYVASSSAAEKGAVEQSLSREIENVTRINLTGARIIGRCRDTKSNAIYSLAELDLKQVKSTVHGVEEMNSGFGNYVDKHGETIFDRMAEERRRGRIHGIGSRC